MKRMVVLVLLLIAISVSAFADGIESIIPDTAIWGISRKELRKKSKVEYNDLKVGKKKALQCTGIDVEDNSMDTYYIFDYSTWDSTGYTYNGLSKIVYLLSNYKDLDSDTLKEIRQKFVEDMTVYAGQPDSNTNAVTTWNKSGYKIEIGIGKFDKYTGSKHKNVAVIFTGIDIPKPVTPPPTPIPTPEHTYIPPLQTVEITENEAISAGIQYIMNLIENEYESSSVTAVFCKKKKNDKYQFTARISGADIIDGIGKKVKITKTSDGMVHVSEVEETEYVYTMYDKIPGEKVWSDGDSDVWKEVRTNLASIDRNQNGILEYDEIFD